MSSQLVARTYPDLGKPTLMDRTLNVFARRYFAGTDFTRMVQRVTVLNRDGFPVILDLLGEKGNAAGSKEDRFSKTMFVADVIQSVLLNASMAIRPGQFENDFEMTRRVANELAKRGIFVWIDVEREKTIDGTIATYKEAALENRGKVGLALQAYHERSMEDVNDLGMFAERNGILVHLRPVRGVYVDEADFKSIPEMHKKLAQMINMIAHYPHLVQHIGSHHPDQLARAINLHRTNPGSVASIQLLYGVYRTMPDFLQQLEPSLPVEIYTPFGPSTAAYLKRRLQEAGGAVIGLMRARMNEGKNMARVEELTTEQPRHI